VKDGFRGPEASLHFQKESIVERKGFFWLLAALLTAGIATAYSNHFENGFHFDDSHVIEHNLNIRDLRNIPKFFTNAATFSSLPANQSYRPVLTTLFAIAYRAGDGSSVWFHIIGFFLFMVLGVLLFFLFRRIFRPANPGGGNDTVALLAAGFYTLHTANAETVNYISAGSDLLSTLLMVASLLIFAARPAWRKFGLYLLPAGLAVLTKEVSVIFPLFLLTYVLMEKKFPLTSLFKAGKREEFGRSILMVLPSALVCGGLLVLCSRMIPATYTPGNFSRLSYVLAQPFVIVHYFNSFLLPFNLSADTDWTPIGSVFDDRVMVGAAFIVLMAATAVWASRKDSTMPISFGLMWFLIGVMPPSSGVVPLSEVMNDHRMFLPFIGLTIAASWAAALAVQKRDGILHRGPAMKAGLVVLVFALFSGHACGTFQRNKVWKNEETLWHDVTLKCPGNARGLMNYGLALMSRGDVRGALGYFERGLELSPNYAYLHINIAIALDALGQEAAAQQHFRKALECDPGYFGCYYYYARFFHAHNRPAEALPLLAKAVELSPGFSEARYLLMRIYAGQHDWNGLGTTVAQTLEISPEDPTARLYREIVLSSDDPVRVQEIVAKIDPSTDNYLRLSLTYYQSNRFDKCIEASRLALKLKPACVQAYNNICIAYVRLGKKAAAIEACESALAIDPHFELAGNNLKLAQAMDSE
jgi:tetratricopeptide (TPR) repeat protein